MSNLPLILVALPFAGLFALVLLIGLATGRMPTYRGRVERGRSPLLYWLTALIWLGAIGATLAIPIRAELQRERMLGRP